MNIEDLRLTYALACFGLGLIILSPTLAMVVRLPSGETFSELWILGPGGMAEDYPFNVREHEVYNVSLGVANHMGGLEYYRVFVKFRNQTEPLPDSVNGTASSLDPIFEYRIFLEDGEFLEKEFLFLFDGVYFEGNLCRISNLMLSDYVMNVNKTAAWDEENKGYYFQLFFELWIYNATISDFQYHNRVVWLWLNMTVPV